MDRMTLGIARFTGQLAHALMPGVIAYSDHIDHDAIFHGDDVGEPVHETFTSDSCH
jgi:hypothetical protein